MEALSISASFAGLLGLASSIIVTGYGFVRQIQSFESDQTSLLNEVAQLSGILHALHPYTLKQGSCRQEGYEGKLDTLENDHDLVQPKG